MANPKCPRCKKEITTSIKLGGSDEPGDFQPVCLPCLTKNLKAKARKR
jgi:hypothetical protein